MTVLLTTHYLEEADRLADRLAIVDHGRVVVEGTPEELKSGLRGDAVVVDLHDIAEVPTCARRREPRSPYCATSRSTAAPCAPVPTSGAAALPLALAALDEARAAGRLRHRVAAQPRRRLPRHTGHTLRARRSRLRIRLPQRRQHHEPTTALTHTGSAHRAPAARCLAHPASSW